MWFSHSKCGKTSGLFPFVKLYIWCLQHKHFCLSVMWTCLNSLGSEMMGLCSNLIFNFWRTTNYAKVVITDILISNNECSSFSTTWLIVVKLFLLIQECRSWNTISLVISNFMLPTFITATYHSATTTVHWQILSVKETYLKSQVSCALTYITCYFIRLSSIFLSATLTARHKY